MLVLATAITFAADGVERGPDGSPMAFRIWRAGDNATDFGVHHFTEKSASLLMSEQATRGNLYSIDTDHLSLNDKAPPESRKAVGWHRLAVRNGELWAVDVEWTDAVRAGLTKDVPEWRYFSPAYDTSKDGEIVGYLNTALTNNPATHFVTALASRASQRSNRMEPKECVAAMFGADDEKKKEAKAAFAAMSEEDKAECRKMAAEAFGDGDGEKKPEEKPAESTKTAEEKPEEKAAVAASKSSDAATLAMLGEQDRRIKQLEADAEQESRKRVLATRPDLSEAQRKFLEGKSAKEIEGLLASPLLAKPDAAVTTRAAASQSGVRPTQGGKDTTNVRAARLPSDEHKELTKRFGRTDEPMPHWEGSEFVLPQLSKKAAREVLERHARDYGSDPEVPMRASLPTSAFPDLGELGNSMRAMAQKAQVSS